MRAWTCGCALLGVACLRGALGVRPEDDDDDADELEFPHSNHDTLQVLRSGHLAQPGHRKHHAPGGTWKPEVVDAVELRKRLASTQLTGTSLLEELSRASSRSRAPSPTQEANKAPTGDAEQAADRGDAVEANSVPPPDAVSAKKPEANQTGGENEARGKGDNDVGGEQSGQHPSENANPSNKQAQDKNGDANAVAPGTLAAAVAIAQSQAEEQSGADVKERAEEIGKVEQRLRHDVEIQDLGAWSKDWKDMETLLQDAPTLFDVNKPFRIGTPPDTELAAGDAESEGRTYLGRAAELGWLPGVKGLVEWDQGRNDTGPRLRIDDGGIDPPNAKLSPLTLATENSETISSAEKASVVRYLLMQRASAMVPDQSRAALPSSWLQQLVMQMSLRLCW